MKKYYEVSILASKAPLFFEALNGTEYNSGQKVIVEGARGRELGTVTDSPPLLSDTSPNRTATLVSATNPGVPSIIVGPTSKEDIILAKERELQGNQALKLIKERVKFHKLAMRILSASITLDGSRIVIEFYAEQRVDFRALVHDLASKLKMRIELRQIGPRDRAILMGGRGVCGRNLCCSAWLRDFSSVSIKMAKNQKIPLNPGKVSGACGRLMCCLKFEPNQTTDD